VTSKSFRYEPCNLSDIPDGVTFDVPPRNQGQIVEVAYGDFGRAPNDHGDPWKRVQDKSLPGWPVQYYRRVEVAAMSPRKARIVELASELTGLSGDARYWDLRRTYGDFSEEVLRHLESCAAVQQRDGNHT
jgi:hypothetical protein